MPDGGHPRRRLDDNFASPIRFSLMAALLDGNELDFATLARILEVGDSALSKSIAHLNVSGYVATRRGDVGSRPRTWVRSTLKGERAFTAHLRALQEIVEFGGRQRS
ncbi:DNA-binding MarR family transcriptional regulator [Microbacterium ginsengiterrae]|uniref:DNA-binding MarR family transcriptional regulator n=1 Tax=Microbacterium ginsengiterrae TaxID=546115 RepID=A0A7W9FC10_9MICO|nr:MULTISPECIES: transcriptional regulator [Microbacterium]MBB5743906.1 DNA-binding MarR family transcriptional regulator [Microbacterium ginsengiterrae]